MTIQINDPSRLHAVSVSDVERTQGTQRRDIYAAFGKRAFDILLVVATAPLTVPLLLMMAVLVALDGHSPLYIQKRVGRNGRVFRMFKFRSMLPEADHELDLYLETHPDAQVEWNHSQKLKNDPRVTRVGQVLRKCSLDELPQLWNVLKGDMSLVGPRPMMVDQTNMYPGSAYYALRPGISGLWQVTARNDSSFTDRAKFDDQYFYNLSFATDCSILAKTFVVVFRGTGY